MSNFSDCQPYPSTCTCSSSSHSRPAAGEFTMSRMEAAAAEVDVGTLASRLFVSSVKTAARNSKAAVCAGWLPVLSSTHADSVPAVGK